MNADQEDLEYYRSTFGFDPDADLAILDGPPRVFRYEASFPLENDFLLNRASVEICARTEMDAYRIRNRIIFRRGEREATVDCVHTAVSTLDPALIFNQTRDIDEEGLEQVASTEQQQTRLPLAAHFASLKSYVAGIAELGIGNILAASYQSEEVNPMTLPFGFNAHMQAQVLQALREVAPAESCSLVRDHLVELATNVPKEWFIDRLSVLDAIYGFADTLFSEPLAFEAVDEILQDSTFRVMAARSNLTHTRVLEIIAADKNVELQELVAENPHTTSQVLDELAPSEDHRVRKRVACNPNLTTEAMAGLSIDRNFDVKIGLLGRRDLPTDILDTLAGDHDPRVRQWVARHPNVTPAIIDRLALDGDFRVRRAVNRNPGVSPKLKKVARWENGRPIDHSI